MLDIVAIVGSALSALAAAYAAHLSRRNRAKRLSEFQKTSKSVTVKVDGATYKVKAQQEDIDKFIASSR